ncbi:MAG: alpha-galactosidase [Clostridia bacterium]|nr:alpha-galactosidase [Clostridia bacterium]MBO7156676.1 alpha-galactosidase [Clostridia bacterium]
MKESKLFIKYRVGNEVFEEDLYQTNHYFIEEECTDNGVRLVLNPKQEMELIKVELKYLHPVKNSERFYYNGYQAWTTSKEVTADDVQKGLTPLTKLTKKGREMAGLSGDYFFIDYDSKKAGQFHSFTYAYYRRDTEVELYGSMNERTGFTVFYADMNAGTFKVTKDVEGVITSEPYEIINVKKYVGEYDSVFDAYFADYGCTKPRVDHMAGYTSWYNYFQKIDENIILRDLEGISRVKENVSIFQIDDGYEPFVGDWLDPSPKFPNGMKYIADKIHDEGYLAGIWIAPFSAQHNSRLRKEHPDWLLKWPNGKPQLGVFAWGGAYTLDIYNEGAREYIRNFFDVILNEWGYDMVKLDFLYSQCIYPRNGKSRGQIMAEAMDFLRECVGEKLLLGCGVPLGSAFGVCDACRISCDVDLVYTGKFYKYLHINQEIPDAQNAMNNSIFRRHLDGRAFCNDPDVFFLRDFNLKFTMEQKKLLAKVNHLFGNVLFVSDDVGKYGDEEIEIVNKSFEKSNAMIISAEYTDKGYITIKYIENGERKTLAFDLFNGQTSSEL